MEVRLLLIPPGEDRNGDDVKPGAVGCTVD